MIRPEHLCRTERHDRLEKLDAYYKGTQYDGRPDFFEGTNAAGEEVPLRERKPCIIYPLPRAAVQQVVRFTYGEGRFPQVEVSPDEPDAALLNDAIVDIVENGKFRTISRAHMARGLAAGSAPFIMSVKRGRFSVELPQPQHCAVTFREGDPSQDVIALVWCYQFEREVQGPRGPECKRFWFRRDVTETEYIRFAEVPAEDGVEPEWVVEKAIAHGFGFCPVHWTRNLTDTTCSDIDGVSLYGDQLDEFDALNFALSQRHRGIHYLGVPQPYETGVKEGDGPEASGTSTPGYSKHGPVKAKPARKGGPSRVWTYRDKDVSVGLVETTGKAFDVASKHVDDVRGRILEAMGVVIVNVTNLMQASGSKEMSARFLQLAYAPLLALVDELRDATWWPDGLQALLSMAFRITAALKGKGLLFPNAEKVAAVAARFMVTTEEGPLWMPPKLTPHWGDFFSQSNDEIVAGVTAASTAKEKGLVTKPTATKFVAPYFGIDDVDAEVEALTQEADDEHAKLQEAMAAVEDSQTSGKGDAPSGGQGPNGVDGGSEGAPPEKP